MISAELKDGIVIKIIERRHAPAMLDFVNRSRDFFAPWIPFVSRTHELAEVEALIRRYLDNLAAGTGVFYGLWDGSRMIALVLIKDIDETAKRAEIGYMIDEAYARRGLVTAACRMMIDFLFGELGMNKIVICCDPENGSSRALAERLGFKHEGSLRADAVINGRLRDTAHYGLLREEYGR